MSTQQEEFRYPHTAGHRGVDTSIASAEEITPKVRGYREIVLVSLREDGPGTSGEIADRLGLDFPTVQPRTSELQAMGLIEDSGARHPTKYGKKAIVWRVREPAPAEAGI